MEALGEKLSAGLPLAGTISFGIDVRADGRVSKVSTLSDTTRVPASDARGLKALLALVTRSLRGWRFTARDAPSRITLPLVFER